MVFNRGGFFVFLFFYLLCVPLLLSSYLFGFVLLPQQCVNIVEVYV